MGSGALVRGVARRRLPVVFVRHDSDEAGSPLEPGQDGNAFKPELTGEPDLLVTKQTDSAFYGEPDLHAWLRARGQTGFAVCGIQTNHCVETTARMGELTRATLTSLHGEFATRGADGGPAGCLSPTRRRRRAARR